MKNILLKSLFILGVLMIQSISVAQAHEPPCWFDGSCDDWLE